MWRDKLQRTMSWNFHFHIMQWFELLQLSSVWHHAIHSNYNFNRVGWSQKEHKTCYRTFHTLSLSLALWRQKTPSPNHTHLLQFPSHQNAEQFKANMIHPSCFSCCIWNSSVLFAIKGNTMWIGIADFGEFYAMNDISVSWFLSAFSCSNISLILMR